MADCLSTSMTVVAGMVNAAPLLCACEASQHTDAEIAADGGNEALYSIKHLLFLEAVAPHCSRNHPSS